MSRYDPALQGKTGLMTRFGPHDPAAVAREGAGAGVPNFHGVASCVDYLTGSCPGRPPGTSAAPPPHRCPSNEM